MNFKESFNQVSLIKELHKKIADFLPNAQELLSGKKLPFDNLFGPDKLRLILDIQDDSQLMTDIRMIVRKFRTYFDNEPEYIIDFVQWSIFKSTDTRKKNPIRLGKFLANAAKRLKNVKGEYEKSLNDRSFDTYVQEYLTNQINTIQVLIDEIESLLKISDLRKEYENSLVAATNAVIFSRAPIDIARMSDHDAWHSCHSPDSNEFPCAVADAFGRGAIAYLVKKDKLANIDLQQDEIFSDSQRGISGVAPLARLRIRLLVDEHGNQLAVPAEKIYGRTSVPYFKKIVYEFCSKQDISQFDFDTTAKLLGGSYLEDDIPQILEELFGLEYRRKIKFEKERYEQSLEVPKENGALEFFWLNAVPDINEKLADISEGETLLFSTPKVFIRNDYDDVTHEKLDAVSIRIDVSPIIKRIFLANNIPVPVGNKDSGLEELFEYKHLSVYYSLSSSVLLITVDLDIDIVEMFFNENDDPEYYVGDDRVIRGIKRELKKHLEYLYDVPNSLEDFHKSLDLEDFALYLDFFTAVVADRLMTYTDFALPYSFTDAVDSIYTYISNSKDDAEFCVLKVTGFPKNHKDLYYNYTTAEQSKMYNELFQQIYTAHFFFKEKFENDLMEEISKNNLLKNPNSIFYETRLASIQNAINFLLSHEVFEYEILMASHIFLNRVLLDSKHNFPSIFRGSNKNRHVSPKQMKVLLITKRTIDNSFFHRFDGVDKRVAPYLLRRFGEFMDQYSNKTLGEVVDEAEKYTNEATFDHEQMKLDLSSKVNKDMSLFLEKFYEVLAEAEATAPPAPDENGENPGDQFSKEELANAIGDVDIEEPVSKEELELAKFAIRCLYFNTSSKNVHQYILKIGDNRIPFEKIPDYFEETKNWKPVLAFIEFVMDKFEGTSSKWREEPEVKNKSLIDKMRYFNKTAPSDEEKLDNGLRVYWVRIILNCLVHGRPDENLTISDVNEKNLKEVFRLLKQHYGSDVRGIATGLDTRSPGNN